jgi:diguanylate cyclase (GGDEF)-like protein
MFALYELARGLAGQASVTDAGDVIAQHLRRLVPFSLSVLYLYDDKHDLLTARHAFGDMSPFVSDLKIALGTRVSGWVAANRQTIVNSDPVLDLGEVAKHGAQRLRSCLSAPLISNDKLVGVLSLYSTAERFSDDHRRIIEAVSTHLAHTFWRADDFNDSSANNSQTSFSTIDQFHQFLDSIKPESLKSSPVTVLYIDVVDMRALNEQYGRNGCDEIIRLVGRRLEQCLRTSDHLFQPAAQQFIAVISGTECDPAEVASRIRDTVCERPFAMRNNISLRINIDVRSVHIPPGTGSVREFVASQLAMSSHRSDRQIRRIH